MPKLRPHLPTMSIKIQQCEWRCGDGCCSDSWYEVELYVDHGERRVETREQVRDLEACILELLEEAETEYGVKSAQVNIEGDPWGDHNRDAEIVYIDEEKH